MHEDFVDETLVEFEVVGKKFKYRPVTAGEENDWISEYTYYEDGIFKQRLDKLNECKTRNIVEVPYSKEDIKKIMGVDMEWSQLSRDAKWNLFKKLKPRVLSQIIIEINKIDSGEEVKKNLADSSKPREVMEPSN